MNSLGYIVMGVVGCESYKYGYCELIKANPIQETVPSIGMRYQFFTPHEYEETEYFIVPEDSLYLDFVITLAKAKKPWKPQSIDFFNEIINYKGKRHLLHIHIDLSDL